MIASTDWASSAPVSVANLIAIAVVAIGVVVGGAYVIVGNRRHAREIKAQQARRRHLSVLDSTFSPNGFVQRPRPTIDNERDAA